MRVFSKVIVLVLVVLCVLASTLSAIPNSHQAQTTHSTRVTHQKCFILASSHQVPLKGDEVCLDVASHHLLSSSAAVIDIDVFLITEYVFKKFTLGVFKVFLPPGKNYFEKLFENIIASQAP